MSQRCNRRLRNVSDGESHLADRVFDFEDVIVPRQLKISSKHEDNSIEAVRKCMRSNLVNHGNFDVSFATTTGKMFFHKGVFD